nr:M24 family metallopeptidase [Haloarchaeobius litoreus]
MDSLLADRGLEAVWFARPNAFAWLTGGDNLVDRHAPVGTAAAGYDGDELTVVTDSIEEPRLRAEELPDDVRVVSVPWHESSLAAAVADHSPVPAGADFDVPGFERIDGSELRQPLTPDDLTAYRTLGRETAAAVETVCRTVDPDATERETATEIRCALAGRDIEAPVVLVGGGARAPKYRHYTPQDAPLGDYALVSVTATRDGLYASCTRTIAFDPPAWLQDRHAIAARVETTALAATRSVGRAGGTAGDVFTSIRDAYAAGGVPEEWREHHQGGAAGYAGREWIATPDSDAPVTLPMAYAWNPTVRGAKSEDTVVVDDGFEVLTDTGEWPTQTAEAVGFDVSLPRPAVLER